MTKLLELRENLKQILSRYDAFIIPVGKFLLAFLVLSVINGQMGFMERLDNVALVLIVALACSFLPMGSIVFFGAVFSLVHMYALSIEVALVGLCFYLLILILFLRLTPKDSLIVLLTPLLFFFKIPYVLPVALGLLCTPATVVSMGCGIVIYYVNHSVVANATNISTLSGDEAVAKIRLVIDGVIGNKEMVIVVVAFAVACLAVYFLRRLAMEYSWTIAIVSGAMLNLIILMMADLLYDVNVSVLGAILGSIIAIGVGKVIEFLRFCVDYRRTENVQFEDDEYYYYVKAVPKLTVTAPAKTVKRINRSSTVAASRSVVTERSVASGSRSANYDTRNTMGNGNVSGNRGTTATRGTTYSSQRSATHNRVDESANDDYEEIY